MDSVNGSTPENKAPEFDFRSIKTVEDAFKKTGNNPDDIFHEKDRPHEVARKKLEEIFEAFRNGRKIEFSDKIQKKWFPVFDLSSGCRFVHSGYRYYCSDSGAGVRLCTFTEEESDYIATQFPELWADMLTK